VFNPFEFRLRSRSQQSAAGVEAVNGGIVAGDVASRTATPVVQRGRCRYAHSGKNDFQFS
jgi:hypothetical protein